MSKFDRMEETKFTVRGRGSFPVDMLRYDQCYPDATRDALLINVRPEDGREAYSDARDIRLVSRGPYGTTYPTWERWASFTWSVVEVNGRRVMDVDLKHREGARR